MLEDDWLEQNVVLKPRGDGNGDIDAAFIAAGLKTAGDPSLLAVSNGTSALIYLHPDRSKDGAAVLAFLQSCRWAGGVLEGE